MSSAQVATLVAVGSLVAASAFLAMAETSLTHLPRAKARTLEEERRRGGTSLARLLEHRERVLNPVLLLVLVCHLSAATLLGVLAQSYYGPMGIAVATALLAVVIFVCAEAAPKTWALQHPERSALLVAPVVNVLASFPARTPAHPRAHRPVERGAPGQGTTGGPVVSEEELLAFADVAVEADVIEVEERALIRSIIDAADSP